MNKISQLVVLKLHHNRAYPEYIRNTEEKNVKEVTELILFDHAAMTGMLCKEMGKVMMCKKMGKPMQERWQRV